MAIDFGAAKKRAKELDAANQEQRRREQERLRANEQAAMERHGYGSGAMEQLVNDLAGQRRGGGAVDFAAAGQRRGGGSGLRTLAEELDGGAASPYRTARAAQEQAERLAGAAALGRNTVRREGLAGSSALAALADEIGAGMETARRVGASRGGASSGGSAYLRGGGQSYLRGGAASVPASDYGIPGRTVRRVADGPTAGDRVMYGLEAAASGWLGGLGSSIETAKAAVPREIELLRDARELAGRGELTLGKLAEMHGSGQYAARMDMESEAARQMERAETRRAQATEGFGSAGAWVGDRLIDAAQGAPDVLLHAAVGPWAAVTDFLGAGGEKAYELQRSGVDAKEALLRGAMSGGIDAAAGFANSERLAGALLGDWTESVGKLIGRQALGGGLEGLAGYVGEGVTDRMFRDPNADLSLGGAANAALGGAFTGAVSGAAALGANAVGRGLIGGSGSVGESPAVRDGGAFRDSTRNDRALGDGREIAGNGRPGAGTQAGTLGENGRKNYSAMRERDGGKTPDFDAQYRHYYDMARSGLEDARIPQAASKTPVSESIAQAAIFAGRNDGLAEAEGTVRRLLDGEAVGNTEIDRALSFPESRKRIEQELTGPLPENGFAAAREYVREAVRLRNETETSRKAPAGDLAETEHAPADAENALAETEHAPAADDHVLTETEHVPADAENAPAETENAPAETDRALEGTEHTPAETESGAEEARANPKSAADSEQSAPGLARNEHSGKLDAQTFETLDRIAKRAGVAVEVSDKVSANGEYRDGKIFIRADAENPVRQVFVHELTHHLETSGDYQALSDRVIEYLRQSGEDVELQTAAITQEYARRGVYLSEEGARKELVAKFAEGNLFTDERSIRRLAGENRGLARKICDWIRDMLARFDRDPKQRAETKFLQQAERLYEKALGGAEGRQAGESQYLFVRALDSEQAERMESDGEDRDAIWRETGLIRDAKGNWVREIDDSGAQFYEYGEAQLSRKEGYRRLQELQERDLVYDDLSDAERTEMERLDEIYSGEVDREKVWLNEFLRHDELEKLPSKLRHTKLEFQPMDGGAGGYFDRQTGTIVLNETYRGMEHTERKTLLHEIQHVLQEAEGRPGGASPQYWERNGASREDAARLYRDTAGEIEARETAGRMSLTAEQRREKTPDLGWERAVFAEDAGRKADGKQYAIETLPDGRRYVKADRQVISGEDSSQWLKQAERFINEKIRGGEDITVFSADGHAMQITERSAYKLTDPHVQSIQKVNRAELAGEKQALKGRIAGHIDEVIQTSRQFKSRPDVGGKHRNDIGEDGFNYYAAYFEDAGGEYYRVVFSAGVNGDAETAYSIGDIQQRRHPAGNGSSAPKGGALGAEMSSEISIAQSGTDGKGQKSHGGSLSELNRRLAKLTPEEARALKAENRRQKERITYLEGQLKRTPPERRSEQQVKKIARDVLREYESRADKDGVTKALQKLYDDMSAGGERSLTKNLYPTAHQAAVEIVKESRHLNDELARQYKGMRDMLRTTPITLAQQDRLSVAEGYNDFRKRNMGRLRLVGEGGMPVDAMYEQLRADYGEAFFPADIAHPADRLERIGEVLDSLKPVYENPYADAIGDAAHRLALDLIGRGVTVEAAKPTIADRFAGRLESERRGVESLQKQYDEEARRHKETMEDRQRIQNELALEAQRRADELEALKAHYQERDAKRREQKLDRVAREKLFKVAKRVNRMQATPQNRAVIEELVGTLDLLGIGIREDTKLRLTGLKDAMKQQAAKDPDWQPSPRLLEQVARLDNMQIADMKIEDVKELTTVLVALEHAVQTENKLIQAEDRRDVYAQAMDAVKSVEQAKAPKKPGGGFFSRNGYLSAMLSPERYARRLTGYDDNSPLYKCVKALSDGQRKAQDFEMRTERQFDRWHSDKQFMKKLTGKDAKRIAVQGVVVEGGEMKTVKAEITPAQQVSLYLHSKHYANRAHLLEGGIAIPDAKLYAEGKIADAYDRGVRLKLDEDGLRKLTRSMDSDVREYAEAVSRYFNGMTKDAINETSVALDGYERATVKDYFPIRTDPHFTRAESEAVKFDATLEGWGNLKQRQNSQDPLLLEDVTDVLERHKSKTAQYYGLAVPVRNLNKLLNVTGTGAEWSVKEAIGRKWGDGALKYLENMLADAQGARKGDAGSMGKILGGLRSNAAGAVLTVNPSVIMKQAASYPTAAGVLGWKPLLQALRPQAFAVDRDVIAKYTPDYWYRRKGYSTMELGDIAGRKKGVPKWLNLIQGVDLATTRTLWLASEYYVRDRNRGKADAPGIRTDAYYKQVAEVYNRVIEETQPNYAPMQRPGILRETNELTKSLVMFKTQSFQNFNLLYDAYGNLRAKSRAYAMEKSDANRAALREARAGFSRNVSAQVVSAAVLSGMTFVSALALGRAWNYEDEDGEMTLGSVAAQLGKDFAGSIAGMLLWGSEAFRAFDKLALGGSWYDIEAGGVSAVNDLFSRFDGARKAAADLWEAFEDEEQEPTAAQGQHLALQGVKLVKTVAEACGLPASNVEKLFHAVGDRIVRGACGKYVGQYYVLLSTASAENDSGKYLDLLYQAYREESPEYEALRESVLALGISEEQIESGFQARQKKADAYQAAFEETGDRLRQAVGDSPLYQEQAEQAEKWIQEYARESAKEASDRNYAPDGKWNRMMKESEEAGLEEGDVLLYRLALEMADDGNGSISQAEAQAALDGMEGLTKAQKAYLFGETNSAWKKNPYQR